eukprot:tig00021017_g17190.t1
MKRKVECDAQQPQQPQLLDLPDALLLRVFELSATTRGGGEERSGHMLGDMIDAKFRAVCSDSAHLNSGGSWGGSPARELRVDLRELCRLRGVCRRFAEVVEAGGKAPPARLVVSSDEVEDLDTVCKGAARAGGIEDLYLNIAEGEVEPDTIPLGPLIRFHSLRALRIGQSDGMLEPLRPEHVLSLAGLPNLTSLDLTGGFAGLPISAAALSAIARSGLPLAALRARVSCGKAADVAKVFKAISAGFPALRELLLRLHARSTPAPATMLPPDTLAPLASLSSLRALSLNYLVGLKFSSLEPLAPLSELEHLAVEISDGLDLRPISSLTGLRSLRLDRGNCKDFSFLKPLSRLVALALDTLEHPSRLLFLAPRLRCLNLDYEGEAAGALADTLLRFTALEDLQLTAGLDCMSALFQRPLAAWRGLRALDIFICDYESDTIQIPAAILSRIASELTGLRELAVGAELPLPLPADVAAAFRGRLRRLRADVIDPDSDDAKTLARQIIEWQKLQETLGVEVVPVYN